MKTYTTESLLTQTGTTVTEEDERGWPLSEAGSTTGGEDEDEEDEGEEASEDDRHFPLVIPDNLRAVLERDYHLINDKNKVSFCKLSYITQ